MARILPIVALAGVLMACGAADHTSTAGEGHGWPEELITGPGTGPALYLGAEADSPAVGYVSPGVTVQLADAPEGDRVPVRIRGPLKVRAWLNLSRLAARVQRGGRPRGAPVSLAANDIVGVRGMAESGLMRLSVSPWLGRADMPALGPFVGEYPADRLGALETQVAEQAPSEQPHALPAAQEVPVYDRPNGAVIATLPALDPPITVALVRERNGWKAVRIGHGPYLVGYVNVDLTPAEATAVPAHSPLDTGLSGGGVPLRLRSEETQPLWRLKAGTRIRFDGRTVAILGESGYAREMNRYDTGEVDVFAATNDHIAIRGMVRASDLEAIPEAQPEAAPETSPAAEAPAAPEPTAPAAPEIPAPPAP